MFKRVQPQPHAAILEQVPGLQFQPRLIPRNGGAGHADPVTLADEGKTANSDNPVYHLFITT